ncbi:MAG TPA: hypothetical protein VJ183_18315 [Chloroflexia bacterium]|nr:hypothetical protein [Chloroflexia bacterium]
MAIQQPIELEGTWEEIAAHAKELEGRRVRLSVLANQEEPSKDDDFSTASSLLKFAGTWEGDDFEECLQAVYDARGKIML